MANLEPNNKITASRQGCILACPRKHYWQFEIGLRREEDSKALAIGSAWHRGMEARWKGATYDEALAKTIPEGLRLDPYSVATVCALLAGYYAYYGERETIAELQPEIPFEHELTERDSHDESEVFTAAGKIDGLGKDKRLPNRKVLVESKTTGESIDPNSQYWLRLRFNSQLYQYYVAANNLGIDVDEVIYDVVRKPLIKPKMITDVDGDGLKIVNDSEGVRVFSKGKPRQTADKAKGWVVMKHLETDEEYYARLFNDTQARPEFYFARREVPILEEDVNSFELQRMAIINMIKAFRVETPVLKEDAWPRHIGKNTCPYCPYAGFCLANVKINPEQPPSGFSIQPFNPELQDENDATAFEETDDSAATIDAN